MHNTQATRAQGKLIPISAYLCKNLLKFKDLQLGVYTGRGRGGAFGSALGSDRTFVAHPVDGDEAAHFHFTGAEGAHALLTSNILNTGEAKEMAALCSCTVPSLGIVEFREANRALSIDPPLPRLHGTC